MIVTLTPLEKLLLQLYIRRSQVTTRARESEQSEFFYLTLYVYPYPDKKPCLKRPMSEWDDYANANEVRIGEHPNKGYWSQAVPHSYWAKDKFEEINHQQLTAYFDNEYKKHSW